MRKNRFHVELLSMKEKLKETSDLIERLPDLCYSFKAISHVAFYFVIHVFIVFFYFVF